MATFDQIIQSNSLVLVDFFATWCGPCQTMAPILQDVKEFYQEDLSIIKIDVDKNPKIASIYKVSGVPTFVLFKNGQQVWRQSGMIPKMELHKLIDQVK
ncbi:MULTISPECIES: thioredoxin [Sphingobacterium]|jgi:thioredoxin 1|uniref:Thioredoxin n=2 Tax=Sphingobacterium TaxID=28453 RepID=A0A653Z7H0_SPHMU|nr:MULTISPECIES: thioredoxin [Sphingobacterium]HBI90780.1 thioredoxin [Sphingobacterium sp.]QQT29913.1 thioredoxin [Sphingobacterium multivorum]QQT47357.1 thioredoxin [Sphingobacterium multivorum]QQT54115.1 thioredoxin [Sphingobacterium multivorum]RKF40252.1 thioredoxin [Sphingobacterium siyangense]